MKKFTNISGSKVGQEPSPIKVSNEELESNNFKFAVMKLMDDFLSIRSYGVARPEIMIPTQIVGKEIFVEALADLISQGSNKDQIKALESLKLSNSDWKSIEEKIDSIRNSKIDIKEARKINEILEKYGSDEDNLNFFLEGHVKKSTPQEAFKKYELVQEMIKVSNNKLLKVISEKYLEQSNLF